MATPDSDALAKGQKIGAAVATPVARYIRPADVTITIAAGALGTFTSSTAAAVPASPFFHVQSDSKVKRAGIVIGSAPVGGVAGVVLHFYKNATQIFQQAFGAWSPLALNILSLPATTLAVGDILSISIDNPNVLVLPSVMFFVELDLS